MSKKRAIDAYGAYAALVSTAILTMLTIAAPHAYAQTCSPTGQLIDPAGNVVGTCPVPGQPGAANPTLSNDGIFGCRGQGANIANVGTLSAIGGIYVPVNDAAVTLNTGYLVYKECVLDGVARKIAESGSAELGRQSLIAFNTGRGGSAQYLVNFDDLRPRRQAIVVADLQGNGSSQICAAFRNDVLRTVARSYVKAEGESAQTVTCPFGKASDQNAFFENRQFTYSQWFNAIRPSGNVFGATAQKESEVYRKIIYDNANIRQMLDWGNGVFPRTNNAADPLAEQVITPSYIIAQSIGQIVGSGYRQLENANEIDQVVANLFGGLTTQLIADTRGLVGLTQSVNGQPSYLDRMIAQTSANVRQQAANAALAVIGAARQIETSYRQAKEGIATSLSNAIEKLRAAEKQCWELIIPKVQERAAQGTQQCTPGPFNQQNCVTIPSTIQLQIATSTQFSQAIIDAQIAPLATTTVREIRNSDAALAQLNQLIASVSNSASQANQQQALLRLDTMVANRQLHTATDANNAIQQRDAVATALTKLVDDTIKAWGDSTDPNVGWCNINNPAVIERWFNEWRQ